MRVCVCHLGVLLTLALLRSYTYLSEPHLQGSCFPRVRCAPIYILMVVRHVRAMPYPVRIRITTLDQQL